MRNQGSKQKLSLKKETLRILTNHELVHVAGGDGDRAQGSSTIGGGDNPKTRPTHTK
jgi:hypothetical protein